MVGLEPVWCWGMLWLGWVPKCKFLVRSFLNDWESFMMCDMKFPTWFIVVMNLLRSVKAVDCAMMRMASTLLGSGKHHWHWPCDKKSEAGAVELALSLPLVTSAVSVHFKVSCWRLLCSSWAHLQMMTLIKSFYHSSNCNLYLIEVDAVIEAN